MGVIEMGAGEVGLYICSISHVDYQIHCENKSTLKHKSGTLRKVAKYIKQQGSLSLSLSLSLSQSLSLSLSR